MDSHINNITTQTLTPIIQNLFHDTTLTIQSWDKVIVRGGTGGAIGGTALFRFTGWTTANQSWSVILKVLYSRDGETKISPYYWKREYEVYRSGMLDNLPDVGLVPPKTYGFADFGDSCWVWMEDVQDIKENWVLDDYHQIARHLGRLNGAYLVGYALPDATWLTHDWHSSIVPALADTFENLDTLLEHPLAQRVLPISHKDRILDIWANRHRFQDALATLPRTLCHVDAFRRNLLHREDDIVLIDWAIVGHAGVGEELVCLVSLSQYLDKLANHTVDEVDTTVFDGYVKGLRDAGWTGDEKLARLGYTCAMTLRGLAGVKQDLTLMIDTKKYPQLRDTQETDNLEDIADFFAQVRLFRLVKMADEAEQLLA